MMFPIVIFGIKKTERNSDLGVAMESYDGCFLRIIYQYFSLILVGEPDK